MATPTADSYTAASGTTVRGGRGTPAVAAPPALAAMVGDSLTYWYNTYSPWYWQNAIAGGVLKTIHNAGINGDTVAEMLARINNSYTTAAPNTGLAGLPPLGWIALRAGTNNLSASPISATTKAEYVSLIAALKTYLAPLGKILVFALPPVTAPYESYNANVPGYNAYLQSLVAADPTLVWIDDTAGVKDGAGAAIPGMFADSLHMNAAGTMRMGLDGGAALATVLAPYGYTSPVSTDPADVYPATAQWNTNHVNSGSVAVTGAIAGTAPAGYVVTASGAGIAGSVSIVPADASDANKVPWLRITPTQTQSGSSVSISHPMSGPALTSTFPESLDIIVQVRFNGFDASQWSGLRLYSRRPSSHAISRDLLATLGGSASLSTVATFRHAYPRVYTGAEPTMDLQMFLMGAAAYSGDMGSIDIRCITFRG